MKSKKELEVQIAKKEIIEYAKERLGPSKITVEELRSILNTYQSSFFVDDIIVQISNLRTYKVLYYSSNIEDFSGYTPNHYYKEEDLVPFERVPSNTLKYLKQSLEQYNKFCNEVKPNLSQRSYFVNQEFLDKNKEPRRFFTEKRPLTIINGKPEIVIYFLRDITPFTKSNAYWFRFVQGNNTKAFCSHLTKKTYADILTPKEKAIVSLCSKSKTYPEIAKLLNISKQTVIDHVKNGLKKTSLINISSLCHIAKLAKVIK